MIRVPPSLIEGLKIPSLAPSLASTLAEGYWSSRLEAISCETLVNVPPRVVFVWVPKTAGSAIARWLRKSYGLREVHNIGRLVHLDESWATSSRAITFGHQSIDRLIQAGVTRAVALNQAFSFAIVRNPYTRAVSLWRYLVRIGRYPQSRDFERFVRDVTYQNPRPGLYNQLGLSMASPMTAWVRQQEWNGPRVIYRFEDLQNGVKALAHQLSVHADLRPRNRGLREKFPVSVSRKTVTLLQEFYWEDFESFGYSLEPPPDSFGLC